MNGYEGPARLRAEHSWRTSLRPLGWFGALLVVFYVLGLIYALLVRT